jgi:hypothetical protein
MWNDLAAQVDQRLPTFVVVFRRNSRKTNLFSTSAKKRRRESAAKSENELSWRSCGTRPHENEGRILA